MTGARRLTVSARHRPNAYPGPRARATDGPPHGAGSERFEQEEPSVLFDFRLEALGHPHRENHPAPLGRITARRTQARKRVFGLSADERLAVRQCALKGGSSPGICEPSKPRTRRPSNQTMRIVGRSPTEGRNNRIRGGPVTLPYAAHDHVDGLHPHLVGGVVRKGVKDVRVLRSAPSGRRAAEESTPRSEYPNQNERPPPTAPRRGLREARMDPGHALAAECFVDSAV